MYKPKNFIILCTGRVGSTWFVKLLGQHPQILAEGERLQGYKTAQERHAFIDGLFCGRNKGFACGLKIQNSEPGVVANILERYSKQDNMAFIFMRRRNKVKQAVSFMRGLQLAILKHELLGSGHPHVSKEDLLKYPELNLSQMTIDVGELQKRLQQLEFASDRLDTVQEIVARPVEVFYEEMQAGCADILANMCRLLRVEEFDFGPEVIAKHTPDDLSQVLTNFDEIQDALRGSPYESMLLEK